MQRCGVRVQAGDAYCVGRGVERGPAEGPNAQRAALDSREHESLSGLSGDVHGEFADDAGARR